MRRRAVVAAARRTSKLMPRCGVQVSLEEKVWQCEETGKVCFNEQQVDLHKSRVPEAKTFTEKTVR